MTRNTPSLEHIRIEFACEEGALRRTLGVIEARGFSVRSMQMGSDGDRAVMTLALAPMDPSRRIDTLLRQLDRTAEDWARSRLPHLDPDTQPFTPRVDVTGPYTGQGNTDQWGEGFANVLIRVMEGDLSIIPDQYDRACHLHYPCGVEAHGPEAADRFWLGLRAALPSARFEVHHRIGMEEPLMPPRAALRWSLKGRHEGWGAFGAPTGADIYVMGISHAEFGPGGLRREWTLYDEAAVWTQIVAQTG